LSPFQLASENVLANTDTPWHATDQPPTITAQIPQATELPVVSAQPLSQYLINGRIPEDMAARGLVFIDDQRALAKFGGQGTALWANPYTRVTAATAGFVTNPDLMNAAYARYIMNNEEALRAIVNGDLDGATFLTTRNPTRSHAPVLAALRDPAL